MKSLSVLVTVACLAIVAIQKNAWSWFCAVLSIALALTITRNSRLTTKIQLIIVGALAGGLGAEIFAVAYHATASGVAVAGQYKETLLLAFGSAIVVVAAMFLERLVSRFMTLGKKGNE